MIGTRQYQTDCENAIVKEWESGNRATAAVLPTGTGKTVVFSHVIKRRLPRRALIIAHREELIWQARTKVEKFAGVDCGIEMGELYVNASLFGDQPVIASTVQTLNSPWGDRHRMGRFKPTDFDTLICDECHHATSKSYRRVFDYFKQNPDLKILGMTATPDRADEEALGQVFDTVAFDYEIVDAINDGWLVPVYQRYVALGSLDLSEVHTTVGDLNGAELAKVMEQERNIHGMVQPALEIMYSLPERSLSQVPTAGWKDFLSASDKRAKRSMMFTVSVNQAEMLCDLFNRVVPGRAAWVCGETNKDHRKEINAKFETGGFDILCNCAVYTEGYDNPGIEVIFMGRPTKSRSLYAQMGGRGTRPLDGVVDGWEFPSQRRAAIAASAKPAMLLVDFVGNSGKHKLMTGADILGGKISEDIVGRVIAKAKSSAVPIQITDELKAEQERVAKEIEARKAKEAARKAHLVAKVNFTSKVVNPFDAFDIMPVKQRGWDTGKILSEAQSTMLLRQGINPDKISYTEGRQLIGEFVRRWKNDLCSLKQATLLRRYGYNTHDVTRDQAKKLLDQLKGRRWKQPTPEYVTKVNSRVEELRKKRKEIVVK